MKNFYLLLCFNFILLSNVLGQEKSFGFTWEKSNNPNYGKGYYVITGLIPYFPAEKAGLKKLDIITHINGTDVRVVAPRYSEPTIFTIQRFGETQSLEIAINPIVAPPANSMSEQKIISDIFPGNSKSVLMWKASTINPKIIAYSDPEIDYFKYKSFDFEYTNVDNPLLEKNIAVILQEYLEQIGLRRDKENPDMLIMLSFYAGKKEQYVPPTQKISTRYKTDYNIWTKELEERAYISSETRGNYTKTEYYQSVKIAFLDANELKKENKVPPVIWQAEYDEDGFSEVFIEKFARYVFREVIECYYPYPINANRYYYLIGTVFNGYTWYTVFDSYLNTGIWYDENKCNLVNYVTPDSPAAKAGIKQGDIILEVDGRKIPRNNVEKKFKYESTSSWAMYAANKYFFRYIYDLFNSEWLGINHHAKKEMQFKIERDKKKLSITVWGEGRLYSDAIYSNTIILTN